MARSGRACETLDWGHHAAVVKLVNTRRSGRRGGDPLEVRVLSAAFPMHAPEVVAAALRTGRVGPSHPSRISAQTGIPRSTVRMWLDGDVPTRIVDGRVPGLWPGTSRLSSNGTGDLPYLLGLYLGDGCTSAHPRGVFKLRISLDNRYPEIIRECSSAISDLGVRPNTNDRGRGSGGDCSEVYSYSKAWPCWFPQHGSGRKHQRPIRLADWQEELVGYAPELFLRGLIHSDGCRFINSGRGGWRNPRYSFSNRSSDIRGLFRSSCAQLGLHCTEAPHTVYVSRKADVARMDRFVGPKAYTVHGSREGRRSRDRRTHRLEAS